MINTYRRNAMVVGILFLVGFLGIPSMALLNPVTKANDVLAGVAANETGFITGIVLLSLMAFACAGIAIGLYPVLKKFSPALAIGSVGFRVIEAALFLMGALCLFALIPISREYVAAGSANIAGFKAICVSMLSINDYAENVLGLMAWNIGASLYYIIFIRTGLVPRWLSVWGLAGVTLSMVSVLLMAYGAISSDVQAGMNAPIGLQELVLAGWLIAKGYNKSALQPATA